MKRAAASLTPWLAQQNLMLYSQADGMPRSQMIEEFKKNPRSVLFGVDSFWQGVDVPGDALVNVIIPRLPFTESAIDAGVYLATRSASTLLAGAGSVGESRKRRRLSSE
mgnify:CR=1 FL=1